MLPNVADTPLILVKQNENERLSLEFTSRASVFDDRCKPKRVGFVNLPASACKSGGRGDAAEAATERDPDPGGRDSAFTSVEKDVNKLVYKKVQCPKPAL